MKRLIAMMLSLVCMLSFAGCEKDLEVAKSSVYLLKDGTVVSIDIESFDEGDYSIDGLSEYITDIVTEYNATKSTTVVVDEVVEENGKAKVKMTYPSVSDYVRLNNITLYSGTVSEAKAAGYDLNKDYFVNNKGSLNKESFIPTDESGVVIARVGVDVIVDGKVLAVSTVDNSIPKIGEKNDRAGYDESDATDDTFIVVYKK